MTEAPYRIGNIRCDLRIVLLFPVWNSSLRNLDIDNGETESQRVKVNFTSLKKAVANSSSDAGAMLWAASALAPHEFPAITLQMLGPARLQDGSKQMRVSTAHMPSQIIETLAHARLETWMMPFHNAWVSARPAGREYVENSNTIRRLASAPQQAMAKSGDVLTFVSSFLPQICRSNSDGLIHEEFSMPPPDEFEVNGPLRELHPTRQFGLIWPSSTKCSITEPCSVVVYLHGVASHGNNATEFMTSTMWGFPQYARTTSCATTLRSVILTPQLRWEERWGPDALEFFVVPLVHHILHMYRGLDDNRVYLHGLSEGAHGAMHAAAYWPHVFAASVLGVIGSEGLNVSEFQSNGFSKQRSNWKLHQIVVGIGTEDDLPLPQLETVLTVMDRVGLSGTVDLHVRVHKALAHGQTWEAMFNQWLDFYEVFWLGQSLTHKSVGQYFELLGLAGLLLIAIISYHKTTFSFYVWRILNRCSYQDTRHTGSIGLPARDNRNPGQMSMPRSSSITAEGGYAHQLDLTPASKESWHSSTVQGLFQRQAKTTPDRVAVVSELSGESLTYAELYTRARHLARQLKDFGVRPDGLVPLMLERSIEMLVGIYGALLAGGAYVPIEPEFPHGRIEQLLNDVKSMSSSNIVLLTQSYVMQSAASETCNLISQICAHVLELDKSGFDLIADKDTAASVESNALQENVMRSLVAVFYTSGSTGRPKGILLEQSGIVNFLSNHRSLHAMSREDVVLFQRPYVFSSTAKELLGTLISGAKLVIANPQQNFDPRYTMHVVMSFGITTLYYVPSLFNLFLDHMEQAEGRDTSSLRSLCLGGEVLTAATCWKAFQHFPGCALYDLYGPSEASVDVMALHCTPSSIRGVKPLGQLQTNVSGFVVDANLCEMPIGETGELVIGGIQLARGYLNSPSQTMKAFLPSHVVTQTRRRNDVRFYRTGDLMKIRSDGCFIFAGRVDTQVKLHGVRIELGGIETLLQEIEGVSQAAVLLQDIGVGQQRLVAYVSPTSAAENPALVDMCQKNFPKYMVPNIIRGIDSWPRTKSGKLDRNALRSIAETGHVNRPELNVAPDSFGQLRTHTHVQTLDRGAHNVIAALVAIHLLWQHWLPHDGGSALDGSAVWMRYLVGALTSNKTVWHVLAFYVGVMDAQQSTGQMIEELFAKLCRLLVLYMIIGLPRWLVPAWHLPTFHRWTCLAYAQLKIVGTACVRLSANREGQLTSGGFVIMACLLALLAPWLRGWPIMPEPIPEARLLGSPMAVLCEHFHYVDMAIMARLGIFYLLGCLPNLSSVAHKLSSRKMFGITFSALAMYLFMNFHVLWTLLESPYDAANDRDWPQYFSRQYYPLRLLADLALSFLMAVAASGNSLAHHLFILLGQNLLGTYVVHLYLRLNMIDLLLEAGHLYGDGAKVIVLFVTPVAYALSVGTLAQALLAFFANQAWNKSRSLWVIGSDRRRRSAFQLAWTMGSPSWWRT